MNEKELAIVVPVGNINSFKEDKLEPIDTVSYTFSVYIDHVDHETLAITVYCVHDKSRIKWKCHVSKEQIVRLDDILGMQEFIAKEAVTQLAMDFEAISELFNNSEAYDTVLEFLNERIGKEFEDVLDDHLRT